MDNWSKMLILQILSHKKMSAVQYTQELLRNFPKLHPDAKVLMHKNQHHEKFISSTIAFIYEQKEQRKVIVMRYYSSSKHLSGLQFSYTLQQNQDVHQLLQRMLKGIDDISKISILNHEKKNIRVNYSSDPSH